MLAIENIEFEDEADMGFKLNSVIKTRKKAEKYLLNYLK
ncbi:MAG: hypothetical protein CI948_2199 [Halanaerobium sp.]|uniref:Uncharacterized protein n=1 Tax=Halanaerobium congolense TaxID=54121 RepID=A0A1G6SS90_9FIRM|nr:MAG: hypothetical protein CI948_2199 [Halanaerobium sp.]SDD19501.1 hypothetical protein SAMN04488597_13228 [Halanaerobium congolense]